MSESLFTDAEVEAGVPALTPAWTGLRERLYQFWTRHLLDNPGRYPYLAPAVHPNPARREGEARRQACKRADEALLVAHAAGLELCESGRIGDLKEIIADFMTYFDTSEGVTFSERSMNDLRARAHAALTTKKAEP